MAARESKGGCAGLVGGIRLPSIESTFAAFRAGALSVNPTFDVREVSDEFTAAVEAARHAVDLVAQRAAGLAELAGHFRAAHRQLVPEGETAGLVYAPDTAITAPSTSRGPRKRADCSVKPRRLSVPLTESV